MRLSLDDPASILDEVGIDHDEKRDRQLEKLFNARPSEEIVRHPKVSPEVSASKFRSRRATLKAADVLGVSQLSKSERSKMKDLVSKMVVLFNDFNNESFSEQHDIDGTTNVVLASHKQTLVDLKYGFDIPIQFKDAQDEIAQAKSMLRAVISGVSHDVWPIVKPLLVNALHRQFPDALSTVKNHLLGQLDLYDSPSAWDGLRVAVGNDVVALAQTVHADLSYEPLAKDPETVTHAFLNSTQVLDVLDQLAAVASPSRQDNEVRISRELALSTHAPFKWLVDRFVELKLEKQDQKWFSSLFNRAKTKEQIISKLKAELTQHIASLKEQRPGWQYLSDGLLHDMIDSASTYSLSDHVVTYPVTYSLTEYVEPTVKSSDLPKIEFSTGNPDSDNPVKAMPSLASQYGFPAIQSVDITFESAFKKTVDFAQNISDYRTARQDVMKHLQTLKPDHRRYAQDIIVRDILMKLSVPRSITSLDSQLIVDLNTTLAELDTPVKDSVKRFFRDLKDRFETGKSLVQQFEQNEASKNWELIGHDFVADFFEIYPDLEAVFQPILDAMLEQTGEAVFHKLKPLFDGFPDWKAELATVSSIADVRRLVDAARDDIDVMTNPESSQYLLSTIHYSLRQIGLVGAKSVDVASFLKLDTVIAALKTQLLRSTENRDRAKIGLMEMIDRDASIHPYIKAFLNRDVIPALLTDNERSFEKVGGVIECV